MTWVPVSNDHWNEIYGSRFPLANREDCRKQDRNTTWNVGYNFGNGFNFQSR